MRTGYVVSPPEILRRAIHLGFVTPGEFTNAADKFMEAATITADNLAASWPEWAGYGSSDFTATLKNFLDEAGIKTEFRNNRLCRKESAK